MATSKIYLIYDKEAKTDAQAYEQYQMDVCEK